VTILASSSVRACKSSRNANSTAARRDSEADRHSRDAATALAMAVLISVTLANSTSAVCTPVAGLKTGASRPEVPDTSRPSIQCEMRFVMCRDYVTTQHPTKDKLLCYKV
jgi:hypothetical protein